MEQKILKKIELLNQATLDSLALHDVLKIVEQFTQTSLKLLDADFGFAWWVSPEKTTYHLMYKSPHTPYEPELPRQRGGNFEARKTRTPFFVEHVVKENYEEGFDVSMHMKSYVIIPITYATNIYGSIVVCFKDAHVFSESDRQLSMSLGNAAAYSITTHDFIQKEQQNMLDLARRRVELDEEHVRAEFIANATHELRTPLAIIKGNVDLALRSNMKNLAELKETFDAIDQEISHLSQLIADLTMLTASRDATQIKIASHEVPLCELVTEVVKRCKTLVGKKGISLTIKRFPKVSVWGDKLYLEKLFANLIKNAIAYGKKGGHVVVSGSVSENSIQVDISDNGIGITPEELPHIFERFYRSPAARAENPGGTGLGLAIVKWIVEAHGGSVSVTSASKKGSTFSITLPLSKVSAKKKV